MNSPLLKVVRAKHVLVEKVGVFIQEKALVGAFSVIVKTSVRGSLVVLLRAGVQCGHVREDLLYLCSVYVCRPQPRWRPLGAD